jgi:hypothetical protein
MNSSEVLINSPKSINFVSISPLYDTNKLRQERARKGELERKRVFESCGR